MEEAKINVGIEEERFDHVDDVRNSLFNVVRTAFIDFGAILSKAETLQAEFRI